MNPSSDLVNRLWRLCALLRKDGVTYQQYVTELTYLLFLKMASEQKDESRIPAPYRWAALKSANETEVLTRYRQALVELGDATKITDRSVVAIFQNASTIVREPTNLRKLIDAIDGLHWFSDERDAFGDAYEGLLQKMAEETKRGAGQYFTPRVLIDVMVRLMQPRSGEVIQDPAAGTGGFLIAADRFMRGPDDDGYFDLPPDRQRFQLSEAFRAIENVPDTYRLLLMNLHLHRVDSRHILLADTLSPGGSESAFKNANLILTNPPFGPAGGPPTRDDLSITDRVSSYQLPFVEHCIRALKPGGRAAIVVPDSVLFDDGRGKALRQRLMNWCDLHTILRLPTGIFYAQGVKTNVLFFTRSQEEAPRTDATKAVWIYDMRAGALAYGKTNPLKSSDFDDFVRAFGTDPNGLSPRRDEGEEGRFRCFNRNAIAARGDNLDISWLKDTSVEAEDGLDTPEAIASAVEGHLTSGLDEVRVLLEELESEPDVAAADVEPVAHLLARTPPPQQGRGGREATDKVIPGRGGLSVNNPQRPLPPGWQWVPLLRLAKQETGHTPSRSKPSYWDGGIPWIGIRDAGAHHGRYINETMQTISEEGLANSSARLLPEGTVCLSRTASVGYVTIMARPMATSQDFATWTCGPALLPEYLMYALMAEGDDIRRFGMGSTHTTIYFPEIRALHIALPPLAQQREIVARVKAALARAERLEAEAARARALVERLEASILAKSFRGEPALQDPADEPAADPPNKVRKPNAGSAFEEGKRGRRSANA